MRIRTENITQHCQSCMLSFKLRKYFILKCEHFFLFVLLHILCFQQQYHSISLSLSFSFSLDFPIFSTCFYSLAPFDKRSLSPFPKCKQLESHKMLQFVALFTFTFAAFTFTFFSLLIDVHSHFHQVPTTWRRKVQCFSNLLHHPLPSRLGNSSAAV